MFTASAIAVMLRPEVLEQRMDIMQNPTYVHRALNVLISKELITECGSVRSGKQYARRFTTTLTREEFAAGMLADNQVKVNDLSAILVAFANTICANTDAEKTDVISELNKAIAALS